MGKYEAFAAKVFKEEMTKFYEQQAIRDQIANEERRSMKLLNLKNKI